MPLNTLITLEELLKHPNQTIRRLAKSILAQLLKLL